MLELGIREKPPPKRLTLVPPVTGELNPANNMTRIRAGASIEAAKLTVAGKRWGEVTWRQHPESKAALPETARPLMLVDDIHTAASIPVLETRNAGDSGELPAKSDPSRVTEVAPEGGVLKHMEEDGPSADAEMAADRVPVCRRTETITARALG
jgi:hypothetical protein